MFGQPAFCLEWRDQSCCSTEKRMEAHVAEMKTRTPGVARDRNIWAYSRKMIVGLSAEVGQHGQPFGNEKRSRRTLGREPTEKKGHA